MTLDEELDDLIAHGYEPKEWMTQTDRVIDTYKAEVEGVRKQMRLFETEFKAAMKLVKEIKVLQQRNSKLLEEVKEVK